MESELPGIIRVKVIAKNTPSCFYNLMSLLEETYWSVFLVKQYTGLIYVKEKLFCLVNWTFPFVGPQEPFSCSKVAKIFCAYEGKKELPLEGDSYNF